MLVTDGCRARESGLSGLAGEEMSDKDPSLRRNAPQLQLHVPEPPFRPG